MSAFEEFGIMPELIQAMEEMDWVLPKPVQAESIPLILGGGDVMCAAETGSGKTGAFCLPILQSTWEVQNQKIDATKKKQSLHSARMNKEDCDATMALSDDGLQCKARDVRLWSGARANYGVVQGKYYYEVKIVEGDLIRIGWSTIEAERELGTDRLGFGYGSTGKKSFAKQFDDYGVTYGKGQIVGCFIDRVESTISFAVNGKQCGPAFHPIPTALNDEALYPAITLKNGQVEINFGGSKLRYEHPEFKSVFSLHEDVASQEKLYERFLRIKERREQGLGHHPTAIIIEPTLELAQQVGDELDKFVKYITNPKLKFSLLVGKKDTGTILRELREGVDIVIGTPGKLMQMLESRQLNLSNIRYFVLDEADRLSQDNLDLILKLYNEIRQQQKERLQVCMFSATLHSPEITALYEKVCPRATWVDLKGRDFVPDTVHHGVVYIDPDDPALKKAAPGEYQDDLIHASDDLGNRELARSLAVKRMKPEVVLRIVEAYHMEQCIIFCRTRLDCDNLKDFLDKKGGGKASGRIDKGKENPYSNVCLHSGLRPPERKENLEMFKEGAVRLLICTDVAARGIDIKELPYVINLTLPDKDEDYIHRVGRVGRADRMGLAVSIVARCKEKVWYHTCPSRGEGCRNTKLVSEKGCAIWYDEPDIINKIETRIQETIPTMGKDFKHPTHKPGEKVVYGKTSTEASQGTSEHVKAIMSDVDYLQKVEMEVQQLHLSFAGMIAEMLKGKGGNRPTSSSSSKRPQ